MHEVADCDPDVRDVLRLCDEALPGVAEVAAIWAAGLHSVVAGSGLTVTNVSHARRARCSNRGQEQDEQARREGPRGGFGYRVSSSSTQPSPRASLAVGAERDSRLPRSCGLA
jgi:hypothetical protein